MVRAVGLRHGNGEVVVPAALFERPARRQGWRLGQVREAVGEVQRRAAGRDAGGDEGIGERVVGGGQAQPGQVRERLAGGAVRVGTGQQPGAARDAVVLAQPRREQPRVSGTS